MYFPIHLLFGVCIAIFFHMYYKDGAIISSCNDKIFLIIGVLSAKENFPLREAVRSTWLKEYLPYKNNHVRGWFIIGKDDCYIPPEYRLSKYGCSKWNINKTDSKETFFTSHGTDLVICTPDTKKIFRQGFSFKVNYPVIVKKLGILFDLLVPNIENKVAILDIQSQDIVVQTKITQNSSHLENGYLYEDVETLLLPKNYEGMILVEGYLQSGACTDVMWNDGGGLITINRIYSTPSHIDSIKFTSNVYSAASIQFLIHDINGLKSIISQEDSITSKWIENLKTVNQNLLEEIKNKQDIVIVDVTETYRNLPIKLLQFYKWIDYNYKFTYFMKTDDDTVINIPLLIESMKNQSLNSNELWIWSRFRNDWPVNYIGKWTDYDYKSSFYPSFPCGALYLISSKTLKWLCSNAEYLFPYQGEDVSMGIWLSAINPNFIDDQNFECDSTCNLKSYNRAQLTADQIYEIWKLFENCNNVCSCT